MTRNRLSRSRPRQTEKRISRSQSLPMMISKRLKRVSPNMDQSTGLSSSTCRALFSPYQQLSVSTTFGRPQVVARVSGATTLVGRSQRSGPAALRPRRSSISVTTPMTLLTTLAKPTCTRKSFNASFAAGATLLNGDEHRPTKLQLQRNHLPKTRQPSLFWHCVCAVLDCGESMPSSGKSRMRLLRRPLLAVVRLGRGGSMKSS